MNTHPLPPIARHGGNLREAIAAYGGDPADWLDCSTGINPDGWPVPPLPAEVWQRLPEAGDGLAAAATCYYGAAGLAVPGSQAAIQALPRLWRRHGGPASAEVAVLAPSYAEHAQAWRDAGHPVTELAPAELHRRRQAFAIVVVVSPNNPTGETIGATALQSWADQAAARGGWLIVDAAFADCAAPGDAWALPLPPPAGCIVLRSVGKFFGLAGLRLGFVFADPPLLAPLAEEFGPWAVAHASRHLGAQALADQSWQVQTRAALPQRAARLAAALAACGLPPTAVTPLFCYCPTPAAAAWQHALAQQRLWVRRFEAPAALRIGLPPLAMETRCFAALAAAAVSLKDSIK